MLFWQANRNGSKNFRLNPPSPHSRSDRKVQTQTATTQSSVYQPYAKKVLSELNNHNKTELNDVLFAVWQNKEITAVCPDLLIRLTSLRGEVVLKFLCLWLIS